jgi:Zn-dependent protease
MLSTIFSGDPVSIISRLLSLAFIVFITMPIHEYAHAQVAYWLGDKTAYYNGRLTLNPIKHLDPIGSALIVLFGFGWAKGVPVNPMNFKNPKRGMALTALAGPVSNLLMAFIFTFFDVLTAFLAIKGVITDELLLTMLTEFLGYAAIINIALALFNFIPIPPLDGSKIIYAILPDRLYNKILGLDRYSMWFLLGILLISNTFGFGIDRLIGPIFTAFVNLFSLIFGLY